MVPMTYALGTSAATVRTAPLLLIDLDTNEGVTGRIGENFSQVHDMRKALDARACDCVMPDLERIGGVTGWQRASALAAEAGVPMSSHLYPEVSAHLLAATPTAHWLEYVDWMNPLLAEPLAITGGMAVASERPGLGLTWNDDMVSRYAGV